MDKMKKSFSNEPQNHDVADINMKDTIWVKCPFCNKKTNTKVYKETVLLNFPLYCPKCKTETIVHVVKLKMVLSTEPDV